MIRLSKEFLLRLKFHQLPAYRIAQQAGVNPSDLSKIIRGALPVCADDERILNVARVLGLEPKDVFDIETEGMS